MAKKKDVFENIELCEGVELSSELFYKKENRSYSMLIKGVIVYLITMGSLGFFLSCFNIGFNVPVCSVAVLIMAIVCALLYYRCAVENIGYIIFFVIFALLVRLYKTYINSGFYAVMNIVMEEASQYLDVDVQRRYAEQVENRYLTVSMFVLFAGFVIVVVMNVYVSRRMKFLVPVLILMSINMIPLYLGKEPDAVYVVMLVIGVLTAYVNKVGQHYMPLVKVRRTDYRYENKAYNKKSDKKSNKKKTKSKKISSLHLKYRADARSMLGGLGLVSAFVAVMVISIGTLVPAESFSSSHATSDSKERSKALVGMLLLGGFELWSGSSGANGGLRSGELGDVASVNLDYMPDLRLRFAPYSYENIYLKCFTGDEYVPYENNWRQDGQTTIMNYSSEDYKEKYDNGATNMAKAYMDINKIGTLNDFAPYYTYAIEEKSIRECRVEFYPPEQTGLAKAEDTSRNMEKYLEVPEANIEAVESIVEELGDCSTDEEIISSLVSYYQENIPYTIRPGKTPKGKDFINNFLLEKKKGYCSYFASAATLIFRYMGIPARYVEGYTLDYDQILNSAEINEELDYYDYYQGYSELGKTAVVSVELTDADAHAWVEVYDEEKGWYVVDVTPAGEAEERESFWDVFGRNDSVTDGIANGETNAMFNLGATRSILEKLVVFIVALIVLAILFVLFRSLIKLIRIRISYSTWSTNDKLIYDYSEYIRHLSKRNKGLRKMLNYREQIEYIYAANAEETELLQQYETESLISILERAGFSDTELGQAEDALVRAFMKSIRINKDR